MKKVISNSSVLGLCLLATAASASASVAPAEAESPILIMLFVGFFALIIVLQLIPACLLFFGLLKGLFFQEPKPEEKPFTSD